ncbi:MAG: hypothetical protein ACFFKA_06885 [Candidatus Thorarchaeota archaeon]
MNSKDLFSRLKVFFQNNFDLMRHLHVNACWEYKIYQNSLQEKKVKLNYFLYKKDDNELVITQETPKIIPDLILYFTEDSILELIQDNPISELYFERYRKMMKDSSNDKIDSKINKSRFNLLRLGYQKWQSDFKF